MSDQNRLNMFAQAAHLNDPVFKTLENEIAAWIGAGATVRMQGDLVGAAGGHADLQSIRGIPQSGGPDVYKADDARHCCPRGSHHALRGTVMTAEFTFEATALRINEIGADLLSAGEFVDDGWSGIALVLRIEGALVTHGFKYYPDGTVLPASLVPLETL